MHAKLQTMIKIPVKFQKDRPKTVGGVAVKRYLDPHVHFHRTLSTKHVKLNVEKVVKNNFRIL